MPLEDSTPLSAAAAFLRHGAPAAGAFDELLDGQGLLRPAWRRLLERFGPLDAEEFRRRGEQSRELLYEHGVAHDVRTESGRRPRPWELDGLPLPIEGSEWARVSVGVAQRVRLLNLIARDLYEKQTLLREGLLPPEIVFDHPGYLRACHGQRPTDDLWLHLAAVDLARGPDGEWLVLADRTEAPSGAGYALENRVVTSRVLAGVMHECRVERLAAFFLALRETLRRVARRRRDNPRIALLTPGPGSPTWFEDAYLARYLEFTLVEGGDLAVRDGQAQIKTLGGLLPVDVLLRRVDDADCDPLELRGGSILGVPGLLQAARRGSVALANTLGSGLVEAPALIPFLPTLCRKLLGEELTLRSAATWWCGDPAARSHVLANMNRMVIKPAFRRGPVELMLGRPVGSMTHAQLADAIRDRPAWFVGQEQVACSAAPSWIGGEPRTAHHSLRTYAAATEDGYRVMPGGLTRIAFQPFLQETVLASGEGSKDCWVLADGPVENVSLLPRAGAPLELRRSGVELPSRVADNLYWLGRQVERAEGAARLLRTVVIRLTGESLSSSLPELPFLVRGLAYQGQIEPGFAIEGIRAPLPALERALPAAVFDPNERRSLRCTVSTTCGIASNVRDRLSSDGWRLLRRIDETFQPPPDRPVELSELLALLNQLILDLSAFSGLASDSMTRTHGWRFLEIGRRLERAQHTIGLVQNTLLWTSAQEPAILDAVLEVADSRMTYRARYLANLNAAAVLDLILTDETNPRSLAFQLAALADHVDCLPRDRSHPQRSAGQRRAMACLHRVRMASPRRLARPNEIGRRGALEKLLGSVAKALPELSNAIAHRYLLHAGRPRPLPEARAEGDA